MGGTQDPTGLTHLGAREYDPGTGRFVSVDPVADVTDPQQINGYAYSNNNPVTFADPDVKFFGAIIALIRTVVRAIVAVLNYMRWRASTSSTSGGMSTMGSANYGTGGGTTGGGVGCSATYPAYKPGCNTNVEPEDPRAQGSFKDLAAGVGHNIVEGAEALSNFSLWCWIEDCSGGTDQYDNFVEKHGVDTNSKAFDAGDGAAEVASFVGGGIGFFKALAKKLFKTGRRRRRRALPR